MAARPTFSHVVFMTRRFEEMKAWYGNVFRAEVVHGDPALAFLTYDDESHRFAIANLEVLRPDASTTSGPGEVGVNHLAYTYASAAELLETYARLKEQGLTPYWPVHHGFTLSFYYRDPDGNRIELQVESCSSKDAFDYMRSEAFAKNPVGVAVDPEALLARYRAGASEAELTARPDGMPSPIPAAHGLT
jgi:catechol 2,3-dioxygenase-like lactoylglutathione lyase family enzyme